MGKPNLQNLRPPWKKGQCGNPNGAGPGRTPWKPIEEAFKEFLEKDQEFKGKNKQRLQWLIERVFTDAMNGKAPAQALAFDRTFGKAKERIETSGPNGGDIPLAVKVTFGK